jgi:3',5'-cyclic AMP phosphodiesterase CpdA
MWRFVHITDPHLASERDGVWNNRFLCTMMPEVMACLKEDLSALQPEFILATGDICSHQTREAMFEARNLMDSLGLPYYPMGGNHDFVGKDARKWFLEAFRDHLPVQRTWYSFNAHNLHFCVLDPWWRWGDGTLSLFSEASVAAELDMNLKDAAWALPPEQFDWLKNDLEAHASTPTIIAVHEPVAEVPDRMKRPAYNDSGALSNGDLLLDLLHAWPQVKAVFSGHMHMHYIEPMHGITQVVTGALPEYPAEYREVLVHPDRLEIRTRGLSNPEFAKRSLIPGKEWTAGTPKDRQAVIPL